MSIYPLVMLQLWCPKWSQDMDALFHFWLGTVLSYYAVPSMVTLTLV